MTACAASSRSDHPSLNPNPNPKPEPKPKPNPNPNPKPEPKPKPSPTPSPTPTPSPSPSPSPNPNPNQVLENRDKWAAFEALAASYAPGGADHGAPRSPSSHPAHPTCSPYPDPT